MTALASPAHLAQLIAAGLIVRKCGRHGEPDSIICLLCGREDSHDPDCAVLLRINQAALTGGPQ